MRERPILFQGAMVRALLAGTKTQTRRAVKLPHMNPLGKWEPMDMGGPTGGRKFDGSTIPFQQVIWHTRTGDSLMCPHGQPGDQLWVRESHWWFKDEHDPVIGYFPPKLTIEDVEYRADGEKPGRAWRPSIHMPRWASRIQLEITDVRVERVQDISEADASAEGCERLTDDEPGYVSREESDWKLCPQCGGTRLYTSFGPSMGAQFDTDCGKCDTYRKRYRWLWESISGAGSWDANPWVWVIEFKKYTSRGKSQ